MAIVGFARKAKAYRIEAVSAIAYVHYLAYMNDGAYMNYAAYMNCGRTRSSFRHFQGGA